MVVFRASMGTSVPVAGRSDKAGRFCSWTGELVTGNSLIPAQSVCDEGPDLDRADVQEFESGFEIGPIRSSSTPSAQCVKCKTGLVRGRKGVALLTLEAERRSQLKPEGRDVDDMGAAVFASDTKPGGAD